MLAWGLGASLRRQKRRNHQGNHYRNSNYLLGALQLIAEYLLHMVTLVIGMLQGSSVARLRVENLGLPKNKEIKNPSKTKTKHQTKIKTRLRVFLIEKEYFLHCIYQRDHSDADNSSGAKLFIFLSCL